MRRATPNNQRCRQAFTPLLDAVFAIFRVGDEDGLWRYFPGRHAGRGLLPDVVRVVPATTVFEFVGSGADGEALILDLDHVHFSCGACERDSNANPGQAT